MAVTLITGFHLEAFRTTATLWMPEYEQHPEDQSALGRKLANDGEECVVVTHSEHIFNGMRLAVALDHAAIPNVKFINRKGEVEDLAMHSNGRLQTWPNGFFDQVCEDLSRL